MVYSSLTDISFITLSKKRKKLKVAGCWVHAKRKFAELVKVLGDKTSDRLIAAEATKRISEIFHFDKTLTDLDKQQREDERQRLVKPKFDNFLHGQKKRLIFFLSVVQPTSLRLSRTSSKRNTKAYVRY